MRTIVHLSDLHMGRLEPQVLPPLIQVVRGARADLVVISGDFTQRATDAQFRSARAFLDAIDQNTLCVPGNHDVPLWNIAARFLTPFDRYRRHISPDLSPEYEDQEMIVVGVNTARSFAWGEGRINLGEVERIRARMGAVRPETTRIVVTHHPFDLPPGVREQRLVGRARSAMAQLAAAGVHLFLSGHLHVSHVSHSAERYRIAGYSALIVQAGTVSMRGRGEEPSFNVLRLDRGRLEVGRFVWDRVQRRFEETAFGSYRREHEGWIAVEEISAEPRAAPES
jgi:3',5'-cyclic AMP phosphodiesterase CpdA